MDSFSEHERHVARLLLEAPEEELAGPDGPALREYVIGAAESGLSDDELHRLVRPLVGRAEDAPAAPSLGADRGPEAG